MKVYLIVLILTGYGCTDHKNSIYRKKLYDCSVTSIAKDRVINKLYKDVSNLGAENERLQKTVLSSKETSMLLEKVSSHIKICRSNLLSCKIKTVRLEDYIHVLKNNISCE